jgi:hypothetical protein
VAAYPRKGREGFWRSFWEFFSEPDDLEGYIKRIGRRNDSNNRTKERFIRVTPQG